MAKSADEILSRREAPAQILIRRYAATHNEQDQVDDEAPGATAHSGFRNA